MDSSLTTAQVARLKRCTPRTVRQALQDGRLMGVRVTPRLWLIRRDDAFRWHPEPTAGHPKRKRQEPGPEETPCPA